MPRRSKSFGFMSQRVNSEIDAHKNDQPQDGENAGFGVPASENGKGTESDAPG
jgi:hypothetical protein